MISKLVKLVADLRQRWALLAQTLHQWPWGQTFLTLRQRFREDRLGLTAGSLTFTTTIALVPLFTVMLALFSAFPVFARFRAVLEKQFLQEFVPDADRIVVCLKAKRRQLSPDCSSALTGGKSGRKHLKKG